MEIDLLKPRFEVIAEFPNNDFGKIGTILDGDYSEFKENSINIEEWKLSDYPHLFRKLNWWEKREESEMPMYLKTPEKMTGVVNYYKIKKWDMVNMVAFINIETRQCCDIRAWNPEYTYQPSTEQEYNDNTKDNER